METKFTLKTLQERIDKYLAGEKQDKPLLVWFDCPRDFELLNNRGYHNDHIGLADWYADVYDKCIVNDRSVGSPLTDARHKFDADGNTVKLTEADRSKFCYNDYLLQKNEAGVPTTRVYIKSDCIGYIGKEGITSVEYVKMFKEHFDMPSLFFISSQNRENIESIADLAGYEQVVCVDEITSPEEFRNEFFKRAKEIQPATGLQRVDNFILDYLRQAPLTHLTSTFDENERYVFDPFTKHRIRKTTIATLRDYISASADINDTLYELFEYRANGDETKKKELSAYVDSLYVNGNLSLDKMEKAVNEIPDDIWNAWCKDGVFYTVEDKIPAPIDYTDRRKVMILHFIDEAVTQRTDEVKEGFLKFYKFL